MVVEGDKNVKILMTPLNKSTGHTFSKVDPDADMDSVYKLGLGIAAFKDTKYDELYYITETSLESE